MRASKKFAKDNTGWDVLGREVFSITYEHEGRRYHAEVGKPDPRVREMVVAVLESITYLVCTGTHGVLRGSPIMVGKDEVIDTQDFEK